MILKIICISSLLVFYQLTTAQNKLEALGVYEEEPKGIQWKIYLEQEIKKIHQKPIIILFKEQNHRKIEHVELNHLDFDKISKIIINPHDSLRVKANLPSSTENYIFIYSIDDL